MPIYAAAPSPGQQRRDERAFGPQQEVLREVRELAHELAIREGHRMARQPRQALEQVVETLQDGNERVRDGAAQAPRFSRRHERVREGEGRGRERG